MTYTSGHSQFCSSTQYSFETYKVSIPLKNRALSQVIFFVRSCSLTWGRPLLLTPLVMPLLLCLTGSSGAAGTEWSQVFTDTSSCSREVNEVPAALMLQIMF